MAGLLMLCQLAPAWPQTPVTVAGKIPGQFSVTESGAASYRIPIDLVPGVGGVEPKLSVAYNSQSGNGLVGVGWNLEGLGAIFRCPRTQSQDGVRGTVNYNLDDRFCVDGQRLILVSGTYGVAGSEYRTEREGYSKIVAYGSAGNGPAYFIAQTKAGQTLEYGNTADSRIEAQGKSTVRVWAVNRVVDVVGNYMTTTYTEDGSNGDFYPSRIDYTGSTLGAATPPHSARFTYEPRPDAPTLFHAGSRTKNAVRLQKISAYDGVTLKTEYRFSYAEDYVVRYSRPTTIQRCDGSLNCLTPVSMTYSTAGNTSFTQSNLADFGPSNGYSSGSTYPIFTGDWNGDGKMDWARVTGAGIVFYASTGTGFEQWTSYAGWGTNAGFTDAGTYPIIVGDWNGDGRTDWARVHHTGISFFVSDGAGFVPMANIANFGPGNGYTNGSVYPLITGDWDGDGRTDWARVHHSGILFYVSTGTGFTQLLNFPGWGPSGGFSNSDSHPIFTGDWNGDGKTDWGRVEGAGVTFFLSNGTGFDWQTTVAGWGPTGGFSNGSRYPMLLGDWNGDGKTDWARVSDNGVFFFASTGGGFELMTTVSGWNPAAGFTSDSVYPIITGDWNGDGKADWARVQNSGISFFVSTGMSFHQMPTIVGWGTSNGYTNSDVYPINVGDWNGDGKTDWLRVHSSGITFLRESNPALGLAQSFNAGAVTGITYASATSSSHTKDSGIYASTYPLVDLQIPIHVVSQVDESNGIGGVVSTQYTYGGLKAEVGTGRGLLGFRWTKAKNLSTNVESYTEYRQDWPYTGLVAKTETRLAGAGSAGLLKRVTNTYACQHPGTGSACAVAVGGRYFPYASQSVEEGWDLNGAVLPVTTSAFTYGQSPQWGDPTQIVVSTGAGASKTTVNEWWPADTSAGRWISGRLKKATVTSVSP